MNWLGRFIFGADFENRQRKAEDEARKERADMRQILAILAKNSASKEEKADSQSTDEVSSKEYILEQQLSEARQQIESLQKNAC